MLIEKLLNNFEDYKITMKSDKLANFSLDFEINSLPTIDVFYKIERLLEDYPKRDLFDICIKSSDDDFFNIKKVDGEMQYSGPEYIKNDNNIRGILENFNNLRIKEEKIDVNLRIKKDYRNGFISIYSLDDFVDWILNKDIYETMTSFSDIYQSRNYLMFISYDEKINIKTETFQISNQNEFARGYFVNREDILKSRADITSIQKIELNLIPEDFNIKEYNYKNVDLKNRLNSIRDILSVIYISDIALIEEKFAAITINGYKSSKFKISYEEVYNKTKNNYLYEIYKWIYKDGNLIDRSEIARNVVSLHCRYQNILDLDGENLNSIRTNYAYYLKTNTDEFLEETKNLRLSIIEEGKLLSEALYGFVGNMGKNLLAYLTFLATLIISNTLTEGNFNDIFTFEIVQIIALVILGSFLFLLFTNIETSHKNKRIADYVDDLITGYGVVLGKDNVKKIINDVKSYKNVKDSFRHKQYLISGLWLAFNIMLLLALDWISGDIKIFGIMNFFK